MANTTTRGYEFAEPTDANDLAYVSERLARSVDADVAGIAGDVDDLLGDVHALQNPARPGWTRVSHSEEGWAFNTHTRWIDGTFWVSINWQRTGPNFSGADLVLLSGSRVPAAAKPGMILYPAGQVINQHTNTPAVVQVDADGRVIAADMAANTNARIRGLISWPGA